MDALRAPPAIVDLESQIFAVDVWGGLDLWLDAHLDSLALASAQSEDDGFFRAWLSVSAEKPRYAMTLALCDETGIAFFVRTRDDRVRLAVYGTAERAIECARHAISRWKDRGRPFTRRLSIEIHPRGEQSRADAHIEKNGVTLALSWSR
jgi:hypothetical protein